MLHFSENGRASGPVSEAEIERRISAGTLPPDVNVWREGMPEWKSYNTLRASPPPVGLLPLKMAGDGAMGQPLYAGDESTSDPAERLRCRSLSSWATIVVVFIAMFAFLGVLSSRPRIADSRFNSIASDDDSENAELTEQAAKHVPGTETLHARMRLRDGLLTIENQSTFDWVNATLAFDSAGAEYLWRVANLKRGATVSIALGDFVSAAGQRLGTNGLDAENPDIRLQIRDCGISVVRLSKRAER